MKKTLATLCALLLLALPALAENVPVMSAEVQYIATANHALYERYGLTTAALGLFDVSVDVCGETAIIAYAGSVIPESLTGTYYVIIAPHGVQPMWTHDGSLEPWQAGELTSPVWGMPQLQQYLNTSSMEREKVLHPYFPDTPDDMDAFLAAGGSYHEVTHANRGAADSARALAIRAVKAVFRLTEAEAESLVADADGARLIRFPDNHGEWQVFVRLEGGPEEVSFCVTIHAETGVILDIEITSGGIG